MNFKEWLESQGCEVEVTQEDDGSGYECYEIRTPDGLRYDVTVSSMGRS